MAILLGGPISSPHSPGNIQLFNTPTVETTKVAASPKTKVVGEKAEKKVETKAAVAKAEKKVCPKKINKGPYDLDIDECIAQEQVTAAKKAADAKAAEEAKATAKIEAKVAAQAAKEKVGSNEKSEIVNTLTII